MNLIMTESFLGFALLLVITSYSIHYTKLYDFVPDMTFTASAEVIRYLGGHPVFLDVEYGTSYNFV